MEIGEVAQPCEEEYDGEWEEGQAKGHSKGKGKNKGEGSGRKARAFGRGQASRGSTQEAMATQKTDVDGAT